MPFHSLYFLFCFLPLVLGAALLCPKGGRNTVLLAASLFFYFWGAPTFLGWVLLVAFLDFCFSHWIYSVPREQTRKRKAMLIAALVFNLSLLFYFKYANFAFYQVGHLLSTLGIKTTFVLAKVLLPMGISFITFEEISYLMDVYRGDSPPARRFDDYLLFLLLFPHSVAGPIFRWRQMEPQITSRQASSSLVLSGLARFSLGLAKKVLLADQLAPLADRIFTAGLAPIYPGQAWLGLLAFTLQIYFDFSGYSDMAIGLGKVFGFEFKENFNAPYIATSLNDFWKRWHISLTSWFRDYVYLPLGGSRKGEVRTYFNIALVFLLSGLWHGAVWTFVVWGAFHGLLLGLEKAATKGMRHFHLSLPSSVRFGLTFSLVMLGWVFFRCDSLAHAHTYFGSLAGRGGGAAGYELEYDLYIFRSPRTQAVLFFSLAMAWLPALPPFTILWRKITSSSSLRVEFVGWATSLGLLLLAAMKIVDSNFQPFLYFTF